MEGVLTSCSHVAVQGRVDGAPHSSDARYYARFVPCKTVDVISTFGGEAAHQISQIREQESQLKLTFAEAQAYYGYSRYANIDQFRYTIRNRIQHLKSRLATTRADQLIDRFDVDLCKTSYDGAELRTFVKHLPKDTLALREGSYETRCDDIWW